MAGITGQERFEDGTLKLRCTSGSPNPTNRLFITEGICYDADGNDISVLLHVDRAGSMCMLEILKYHPSPIINPPTAENMDPVTYVNKGRIREIVRPEKGDKPA